MKTVRYFVPALFLVGTLGGSALAGDGVVLRQELGSANYCHMKFPAIRSESLGGDQPQLKGSVSGDVIDYYGPCNENPKGADQLHTQQLEADEHYTQNPGHGY